jgi:flagellar basal-body rod modification protein FlgD
MYVSSLVSSAPTVGQANQSVVLNPDPSNPVIADASSKTDGQTFMKLLIEQLKNQDPMNPMQSNEFTQQMATLNSLQELVSLNQLMEESVSKSGLSQASSLIGNYVEGLDANNAMVTGYVERVEVIEGEPTLKVGDKLLLPGQVTLVALYAPDETAAGGA